MRKKFLITNGQSVETDGEEYQVKVYISPDATERQHLIEELKIDEHTLNSTTDPDEQARIEFEPDHVALILKRPKNYSAKEQFLFKVASFGLFLFHDHLIVVLSEDISLFEGKCPFKTSSATDAVLRLIYTSINHFVGHLKAINMISDSLEAKINASMENKYLLNLFTLEKSLVYYLNGISSNARVIEKLKANASRVGLSNEQVEYLDDLLIENNQCYRQAEIYSNILASLMDARVSIVSNNLNVLIKTLNIITIGIMVPTFVVSAFSMNVKIPIQQHPLAFWIIMGLALVSVVGVMFLWKYRRR